jgi:hypothetical protein
MFRSSPSVARGMTFRFSLLLSSGTNRKAELRIHTKFYFDYTKGREHLADVGVDGRIILRWALKK